jgi:HEAT repeat protein
MPPYPGLGNRLMRWIKKQRLAFLIARLKKGPKRYPTMQALVKMGAPAVEALIHTLNHPQPEARAYAAEALGKIGRPEAVQPLLALLHDTEWECRVAAVQALAQLRVAEPLIAAIDDCALRKVVIEALGQLGDRRATEPLVALLHDEGCKGYQWSRFDVARALGRIGDPRAVRPLLAYAEEEARRFGSSGAFALNLIAVEALGQIGDPEVLPILQSWYQEASQAYDVVAEEGGVHPIDGVPLTGYIYPTVETLRTAIETIRRKAGQAISE